MMVAEQGVSVGLRDNSNHSNQYASDLFEPSVEPLGGSLAILESSLKRLGIQDEVE
jgi:hypothetical protein